LRPLRLVLVFARLPRDERRCKPLVSGARKGRDLVACRRAVEAMHLALLGRTLDAACASGAAVRLVTTGAVPRALARPGLETARQIEGTFAERLERAVADAFADGWRHVVVVGGDTCDLDAAHLDAAFRELDAARAPRAVLGPATDGGYYLLGLSEFTAAPFVDAALRVRDAGRATAAVLRAAGYEVSSLAPLHDVDGESDVRLLAATPGPLRRVAARVCAAAVEWPPRPAGPPADAWRAIFRVRGPPAPLPIRP
jgi:glycosyltransferase A (GT-A) superfamily protein (DUF2064 family)